MIYRLLTEANIGEGAMMDRNAAILKYAALSVREMTEQNEEARKGITEEMRRLERGIGLSPREILAIAQGLVIR